jgi:DNA polymerase-3 subunit epsilon
MSELNQSVVVCNLDGRILLYNNRARLQFKALSDAPTAAGGGEIIGLGRSIYAVFERNLIVHALESIQERIRRQSSQPVANFVTTTRAGQLLRVQMAPVLSAGARRRHGVGLRADARQHHPQFRGRNPPRPDAPPSPRAAARPWPTCAPRPRCWSIPISIRAEGALPEGDPRRGAGHERRLDETANAFADSLKTRWPLDEMLGADLVAAAQRRIEKKLGLPTKLEDVDPGSG